VGALGHFIEREGLPTAQISLIREQTAAIRPPRALWVPFMLGRPFGAPNAPDFQRRVLYALLALFEHPAGPVLEDFPDDAPSAPGGQFSLPVGRRGSDETAGDPGVAMQREIAQLAPLYDLTRQRRGRTTVGISGLAIDEAARFASSYLGASPAPPYADGLSAGVALKRACDDLKAYYYEAAVAHAGAPGADALDRWFWQETAAARVFLTLQQVCARSTDASLRPLAELVLVPRAIFHSLVQPHRTPEQQEPS
jgi:hypothetical protein